MTRAQYDIPIYQPDLSGNEKKYVNECLDTSWISSKGRFVSEFEKKFAQRIGVKHAISVSNGTVAIHLALLALGIGAGDEIIVPTLTYVASVNAIKYCNAIPVFVDSCRDSWQMDPEDIRKKITAQTRAIVVVHLYGQACDMDAIIMIARDYKLDVVEDCAEAFGTLYRGRHAGVFGDISTFSFFGNKTITTGEGGMVVSDDEVLSERARHFKGQGLATGREYWHDIIGYNYRMTNIQAAIGLAQLERADIFIENKRRIAELYSKLLSGVAIEMHAEAPHTTHSHWMISLLVKNGAQRNPLRNHLANAGIETRPFFSPVHSMPMYVSGGKAFPEADRLAALGINLPSWPGLSDEQVHRICFEIKKALD